MKPQMLSAGFVGVVLVLTSAVLGAQLLVPAQYGTIQAAIDAAAKWDEVIISDGVYTAQGNRDIDFKGKAIIVRSENGPTNCIIDCQGSKDEPHRGFCFCRREGRGSVIEGVTIKNGVAAQSWYVPLQSRHPASEAAVDSTDGFDRNYYGGGGIVCGYDSSPTIRDCVISDNTGYATMGRGGGILCIGASPAIIGCRIENNTVTSGENYGATDWNGRGSGGGGGIMVMGGDARVTIADCEIIHNTASGYGFGGAGIACTEGGSVTISDCTVSSNSVIAPGISYITQVGGGGGVFCVRGDVTIADCVIQGNYVDADEIEAVVSGGGILSMYSDVLVENSEIGHNRCAGSPYNYEDGGGGGAAFWNCRGTIADCRVVSNWTGTGFGGAVLTYESTLSVERCIFERNRAPQGGALANRYGVVTVAECAFRGNRSRHPGGGMIDREGTSCIVNCIFSDNEAGSGGGLMCLASNSAVVTNCTLTGNEGRNFGGAVRFHAVTQASITNSILWANSSMSGPEIALTAPDAENIARVKIENSDVRGGPQGTHTDPNCVLNWVGRNIDMWPSFAFADDYHLMAGSPCIDSGINEPDSGSVVTDIEGVPRSLDGDRDGIATVDMGAYEYSGERPCIAFSPAVVRISCPVDSNHRKYETLLQLRNCGSGKLNWRVAEHCPWLRATPGAGSSKGRIDEIRLTVDVTGLQRGLYHCQLALTDGDAVNSPCEVPVVLVMGADIVVPWDYETIQDAIDAAVDGESVVVMPGLYNENVDLRGRNILLSSVDPNDDEFVTTTIIDGGADGSAVVFAGTEGQSCTLAGFTCTGGYNTLNGGGVRGFGTFANIENCIIRDNVADFYGGGIRAVRGRIHHCRIFRNAAGLTGGGIDRCDGPITNCVIQDNSALCGGGLCNCQGHIADCNVVNNLAYEDGGGIKDCHGQISNCRVVSNIADRWGGGLENCNGKISDCAILANESERGGGLWRCGDVITGCEISRNKAIYGAGLCFCDGRIVHCRITDNVAFDRGGGLYNCKGSIESCLVSSNGAFYGAGLVHCPGKVLSCVITNNVSADSEAGIAWCEGSIINCTITGNVASGGYGGMRRCSGTITNCIIYSNSLPQIYECSLPSYSCIEGWTDGGKGNFDSDPDFLSSDDYHLAAASPCIDAGINHVAGGFSSSDIDGNERVCDGNADGVCVIDIGACEYPGPVHVPCTLNVPGDCKTVQKAVQAAMEGDTVVVSPGTYRENLDLSGADITLRSMRPHDPAIVAATIIDGAKTASAITFAGTESSQCVLSGLTVTGGYSTQGGGINGNHTRASIENCIITGNFSHEAGGGIYAVDGRINACKITANRAGLAAGGIGGSTAEIRNCLVAGNLAEKAGGINNCRGRIVNCTIADNQAQIEAGGVRDCLDGMIRNCIVWDNLPGQMMNVSEPSYSCIQGWSGTDRGNISWEPGFVRPGYWDPNGTPADTGDDFWVDGDYRLSSGSPCVDAGDPNYAAVPNDTDLACYPRVVDGDEDGLRIIDMGAYEYSSRVQADMTIVPRVINISGRGGRLLAVMRLPHEVAAENVDLDAGFVLEPGGIAALHSELLAGDAVKLFVVFDRVEAIDIFSDTGNMELTVTGRLKSGELLYGTDIVTVIRPSVGPSVRTRRQ